MKTSGVGIELIKEFESLHDGDLTQIGLQPKMCPAGIWTEGYGHAMLFNGEYLKGEKNKQLACQLHTVNNEVEAEKLLLKDLEVFERAVSENVKVFINQNQFDALVSFTYNLGIGNFRKSTLLKKLNARIYHEAAEEFLKWNKCNGKPLLGLTRRRNRERLLFLTKV